MLYSQQPACFKVGQRPQLPCRSFRLISSPRSPCTAIPSYLYSFPHLNTRNAYSKATMIRPCSYVIQPAEWTGGRLCDIRYSISKPKTTSQIGGQRHGMRNIYSTLYHSVLWPYSTNGTVTIVLWEGAKYTAQRVPYLTGVQERAKEHATRTVVAGDGCVLKRGGGEGKGHC